MPSGERPTTWRLLIGPLNTRRLGAANNFLLFTVMIDFWKLRDFVGQPRKGERIGYDEVASCTWTAMTLKQLFFDLLTQFFIISSISHLMYRALSLGSVLDLSRFEVSLDFY
jgi:hypothetical protein